MSLILVAGLTSAMRFIFAGCCARAASGHVAAVPPKSVMNSRRCMHPPEGKLIDASSLTRYDGAAVRKGSQSTLDAATQCPFGVKLGLQRGPERCPLYPNEQRWLSASAKSEKCTNCRRTTSLTTLR